MDPALQELYAEGMADDEIAVVIRLAAGVALPDGARIVARFGPIATCRLRRGDIPQVRATAAVLSMKAASLYGPTPLEIDPALEAGLVNGDDPAGLLPADKRRPDGDLPTGRGTIVAHIDWGLDFAHPEFRDAQGRTRLLALWDQSQPMDPARPNRYGYGRIYERAEIDRALDSADPYRTLGYLPYNSAPADSGTHGTHTMSIAAGNGHAGGPVGIAPEAGLLFVHLSTYTAEGPARLGDSVALLEAFDFIGKQAADTPVAINASIGKHAGEHDGKTVVEQGMDAFLLEKPGRALVLSTGNYFHRDSHAQGLLRPGESRILHLIADAESRTLTEVDLWYPGVDRLTVLVRGPHGVAPVQAAPGGKASLMRDGREIGRLYHRRGDPNNGDNQVTLFLYQAAPAAHWEIELIGVDVVDGRYHAWVERDARCPSCQAHFAATDAVPTCTTGTICNGLRTIAVGAYDAHRQGRPLGRFSSCGPTRDGRQKPDLIAPGVRVLAARSAPRDAGPDTPLLMKMSGTSMAAPSVTGTIALMFEAAGRPLPIEDTRRLLLSSTESIGADASPLDHLRSGSGYLDISAAVAAAREAGQARAEVPAAAPTLITEPVTGRKSTMNESSAGMAGQEGNRFGPPPPPESATQPADAGVRADQAPASPDQAPAEASIPQLFQLQMPAAPDIALPFGGSGNPLGFALPPAPATPAPAPPAAGARPLVGSGARGPAVQEAQQRLNSVHRRRLESGAAGLDGAPLVEDGVFGDLTTRATLSFQRLAFPDEPRDWDGVVGPKTWAALDRLSSFAPLPVPAPQAADPGLLSAGVPGCGNMLIWINAFIPGSLPGYTFTVPSGPHAGSSAVPCPAASLASVANPNCYKLAYLTDQRGFDSAPTASTRMRSLAEVQLVSPRLVRTLHETSGTVEINRHTGAVTCAQRADMRRCNFSGFKIHSLLLFGNYAIRFSYTGAASDPCVNLSADLDYVGDIEILCSPALNRVDVYVNGRVDKFPAFEMYASLGSVTLPLFTVSAPSGSTVLDLLGNASTPVSGHAVFHCQFGRAEAPLSDTGGLVPQLLAALPAADAGGTREQSEATSKKATEPIYSKAPPAAPAPLPFQLQVPLTGGAPALALPFGGAGSPLAFTVPLGATAPAPAPAGPAPAAPAAPAAPGAAGLAPGPLSMAPITLPPELQFYVAPTDQQWVEAGEPGARPLVRPGSRGPAVLEAQLRLNSVHRRRLEAGVAGLDGAPLVEDGVFGDLTTRATLSFQRLAFPDQPRDWDGVVGPKTWAALDRLSNGVQPPEPAPPADPRLVPGEDAGCGNLLIWINAFIPGSVPGYTFPVSTGRYTGASAIPCPAAIASLANPNCFQLGYLTDQRSFDSAPTASARMRSMAEIQLIVPRLVRAKHETSGTIEINRRTGAVTCAQRADMRRCTFSGISVTPLPMPPGTYVIRLNYNGAASDPCVNFAADIDYVGDIEILCTPAANRVEVSVSGRVDSFPAFEMYASLGSVTLPLFRLPPPPGNTVVNLLGGASTPVAGRAVFNCNFGRREAPMVATGAAQSSDSAAWAASAEQSGEAPAWAGLESWEPAMAQAQSADQGESECNCGARLLAVADTYARPHADRPATSSALLESLMDSLMESSGRAAVPETGGPASAGARELPLSPTALFHAFAYGDHPLRPRAAAQRHYARRFELLAGPGNHLLSGLTPRPGDLLVRVARGEGWGQVCVVAAPGAHALARLGSLGLRAEGGERPLPGSYVHVVEILPRAVPSSAGFARRLADAQSLVPGDTLLLRPRSTVEFGDSGEAAEAGEAACGGTVASLRPPRSAEADTGEQDTVSAPPCRTLDQFARDSAQLLPRHIAQIANSAHAILADRIEQVTVTGFASSDGSNEYNLALGMRRAENVAQALRAALEAQRPGSSSSVAIVARSRGEDEQIGGGIAQLNRRVTICPAAPNPQPQPQPVRQRVFRVTAKSFIARIGANVGILNCGLDTPFGNVPSPLTNPALRTFAAATDTSLSEDPRADNIFIAPPPEGKGYRLFSSVRVRVEHRGTELLSAAPVGGILTDAGKECAPGTSACLQAPPLVIDRPFTATRIDASRMRLTWAVKGRPPTLAEPAFQAICRRTSVFIWHRIKATLDCSSGTPLFTSLVVEGSRFPSHRLWLDGTQVHDVPQGPFSNVWDADPGDPTRVR